MANRCAIGRENENGSVDYILCKNFGNPDQNGKMLLEHYQDPDKVGLLISKGDILTLAPDVADCEPFYEDEDVGQRIDSAESFYALDPMWIERYYLFKQDGSWVVKDREGPPISIPDAIAEFESIDWG